MRFSITVAAAVLLTLAVPATARGQAPGPQATGLKVFLDCELCDEDFLRTQIDFVDYVRDRQVADVHVLITTQATGAGGTEYMMRFVGQGAYSGVADDLRHVSGPNDTEDQQRRGMARVLQAGFIRYVARTDLIQQLTLSRGDSGRRAPAERPRRDRWNSWVFELELGGYFERETAQRQAEMEVSASASRTTPAWKTQLELSSSHSQDDRLLRDAWIENVQRDHSVEAFAVRSLTSRWSVGGAASASHSTFENRDLALRVAPMLEYNVFPYSESTRRLLTFQYSLGANRLNYLEQTIFGRTRQTLIDQEVEVFLGMRQPWGSIETELEGAQYLNDPGKYRLEANGGLKVNLFRGLSLQLRASALRIRNQLHLPGGDRTPEEILLEQRELATGYRFGGSVGLSYRFGSIFNSVVNPRLDRRGGTQNFD